MGSGLQEYFLQYWVPNPQEDDAKFCEFPKRTEDGCEQVGFQKRFLKYPSYSVYQAAVQNRGCASLWDSEIIKRWLGTWDAPELLAVSGS